MRLTNNKTYCEQQCDYGEHGECFFDSVEESFDCFERKIYEKLKEYEELEEQGLIVRLPCKVGNRTYQIVTKSERINNGGCTCCTTAFGSDCNCDYYIEDDACNGCGKEISGYTQKRVKGHIWCNECNKKRQRKYVANSKKKSVLAEIKDNLDIHEIDGVLYYKVEDLLELFKQEN